MEEIQASPFIVITTTVTRYNNKSLLLIILLYILVSGIKNTAGPSNSDECVFQVSVLGLWIHYWDQLIAML